MFFNGKLVLLVALALGVSVSPAKADLFFVQDPVSKLSVAYPDTWRRVYNQKPDDVITLAAPGVQNFASCRLRIRDDQRYQMYPARFNAANNRDLFDETFWKEYLAEYPLYRIDSLNNEAGLSRGYASQVQATYISFDDPRQQKQAVIYASLYNGHIYVVDCSAKIEYYQRCSRILWGSLNP
ncbi:MAG: hypothetical protein LRY54_01635 [Alphaproteobacteria bacterium]|nr:hypothetical protein [Alphaproteobacteria bacterium]